MRGYYFKGYSSNYYYDTEDKQFYSYKTYSDGAEFDTSDISLNEEMAYDEFIDRCEAIELAEELTRKKN